MATLVLCGLLLPLYPHNAGSDSIFVSASYEPTQKLSFVESDARVKVWIEAGEIKYQIDERVFDYRYAENVISLHPVHLPGRIGFVWEDATSRSVKSYITWFEGKDFTKPEFLGYSRPAFLSADGKLVAATIGDLGEVWLTLIDEGCQPLLFPLEIQGRNVSLAFYNGVLYASVSGKNHLGKGVHIYQSKDKKLWEEIRFWETEFLPTNLSFSANYGLLLNWQEDRGDHILNACGKIDNGEITLKPAAKPQKLGDEKPVPPLPLPLKNWTLVVFLDGDNNLASYGRDDVNEMETVGSQDWMNIVVLFDGASNGDSCLYYVVQDSNTGTITSPTIPLSQVNSSWGNELNMGAVSTVVDFAKFVFTNFPAKYTLFDFWDHGGSWTGQCWDDTNGDNQEMSEFRQELDMLRNLTGRKVLWDIWTGDECLMASEAVTYQAKAFTNYTINSEDSIAGDGWPYDKIFKWPKDYPNMSVEDFAYHAWDEYVRYYATSQLDTLSVINNTLFDYEVVPLANNLAQKLRHRAGDFKSQIEYARSKAQAFQASYYGFDRDFYHFVDLLIGQIPQTSDPEIYAAAVALRDALTPNPSKAVMWEGHNSYTPNAHGLKCYISTSYSTEFDTMMYPQETSWDEFLKAFIAGTNVPNVEPHVSITSPAEGSVVYQTGITTVTGTADDSGDSGTVQYVQVKVDREDWKNATGTNSWSYALDASKLEPGVHRIFARSYDGKDYSLFASVNITVSTNPNLPDLTVTSISVSNASPPEGQTISINATIANVGTNWSANGVNVGFYLDSVAGTPFAVVNVGDIAAGSSKIASTGFDTTGYAGVRTIYVVADPFNAIAELTDFNNTGNLSMTVLGYNFELTCAQNTSFVSAGGSHIYPVTVKNTGTITDTIQLTINNPTNWSANFNDNKMPGIQKLRTVNGYHTYPEITTILQGIATNYSSIAKVYSIGTTWEGRSIWCLKISDNVNLNETGEQDVAFYGLHHAREWISAEVPLYLAQYLVENYNTDPRATYLVNNREIYIIPVVNPDGLVYCQAGHDWRKNRRNNGDGTYGVDLNRNYNGSQNGDSNGAWGGAGSSHTTSSETYCGPSAFSEPETQAIRDFVIGLRNQNNQLAISISYHSYGEVVYYPWGYAYSPEHGGSPVVTTPDVTYQKKIAQDIASRITSQSGTGTYDPMQSGDSYLTTGDTDDWTYGYSKYVWGKPTFSFTIELGTSFQPPAAAITQICQSNLEGALYAIWRAGDLYFEAPAIQHTPLQNTSDIVNGYTVNATITSNLTLTAVKLYWKTTGSFYEVQMTTTDGRNYTGTIPAQSPGTTVYYYIEAKNSNTTSTSPQYAPDQLYSFKVRNENLTYNVTLLPGESRIVNLTVTAPSNAQPLEMANITVIGTSQGNSSRIKSLLTQTQVKPQMLLVDDTSGSYLTYYTTVLNSLGLTYDTLTSSNALSMLANYQTVLWICKGTTTLGTDEKTALSSFLNGGGRLFISGEDIGYDIATDSDGFYQNYMHASYISDDANINSLAGISGDPVSDGFTNIQITGSYPDVIAPKDSAATVSFYYQGTTQGAALRVDTGIYRVYYLACEYFEGSDTATNKSEIMRRILTWLNVQHDLGIADLAPPNLSTQPYGVGEVSAVVRNYGLQTCGSSQLSFDVYTYTATTYVLLNETFESGTGSWTLQSPWGLTTTAHTGTYALTDSPSGNYQNSVNISATYNGFISIPSGAVVANFSFWHRRNLENGYDYGYVEVSTDGSTWQTLAKYTGNLTSWTMASFDLSGYAGLSIKLRFRLYSDYSVNYDGWYIDDISITAITLSGETYLETRNFSLPSIASGSSVTQGFTMPFTASAYKVVAKVTTCTDEFPGNNQKTTIFFVEASQFTVQLKKGLNFITLPVSGEKDLAQLLTQINGKYNIVWYFSPSTNKWLKYVPWQSTNTLTTINSTMAIAINVTINCAITLSEFQVTANTTLYLKQGWNMVGINLNKSITAGQLLALLPSGSTIETIDAGLPYSLTPTTALLSGKGYWIYVPTDVTLPL
ncbi:MAG: M14 family zinc carboxypeptidase [Thermoplasmata archaeon]|nr:M14 family zinc carboxypeptidase [Thermoplasmata archaeon]